MSFGIRNGTIVTAVDGYAADLRIEAGRIVAIGAGVTDTATEVLDATGLLILPGGIDAHTHFDLPVSGTVSADDFETGTCAAAFGGTTTCIDFATPRRGESLRAALDTWHAKAAGKACVDYGFHMILPEVNASTLAEMRPLMSEGITSFKLFMAYPGRLMSADREIFQVMQQAAACGALVQMHAENGAVIDLMVEQALAAGHKAPVYHALTRPSTAEGEATQRAIALAEMAGAPLYVVHVSAEEAVEAIARTRCHGALIAGETCPHYLFLSHDHHLDPDFQGAKYVCSPPLRPRRHAERLWQALQSDQLSVVATDHCPFNFHGQKELGLDDFTKIPNGVPGVENRLQLLYHGGVAGRRFNLHRFVQLTATAPAKIFGLFPRKGTIAVGSDADLVLFDPSGRHTITAATHHMRVDYNPYEGFELQGQIVQVVSRGELIVDRGRWRGRAGHGTYLARGTPTMA